MAPKQIIYDAPPDQVFSWQLYVQPEVKKSEDMLARINKLDAIKFICLTSMPRCQGSGGTTSEARTLPKSATAISKTLAAQS
jgi:hypothetical protein